MDLAFSEDAVLSGLEGKILESTEVLVVVVVSSGIGENVPLKSVDGDEDDITDGAHGDTTVSCPSAVWLPFFDGGLQMTTVELQSDVGSWAAGVGGRGKYG